MLNDLKEIIAIQSIMGDAKDGAPFGQGPKDALEWFLAKADAYGLKTGRLGGYCGWAEVGDGEQMLGILGHLDVVPVGKGWSNPPFTLVSENGYLYGRGVVDDKGPTVVALHVLKKLKDMNTKLKHRVRLIVGCNEENGSACIKKYVENCEIPAFSFVPDADFPVINSEKGIAEITVELFVDTFFTENLTALNAGVRSNVVPDLCTATVKGGSPLYLAIKKIAEQDGPDRIFTHPALVLKLVGDGFSAEDFSAHIFPDRIELESRGIAGHAMAPEKGENAFWKMLSLLSGFSCAKSSELLELLNRYVASPLAAERLGIAAQDEESGALTTNCGLAVFDGKKLTLTLNLRLPISSNIDEVTSRITAKMPSESKVILTHWSKNLYVDPDSMLIRTLLEAYVEQTGEKPFCVRCGGGTYARELPNAVAFGPTFEGAITNIHNVDECISVIQFEQLFDIYLAAVLKLDEKM